MLLTRPLRLWGKGPQAPRLERCFQKMGEDLSAYLCWRMLSIRQHPSASVSMRQHSSACVSMRQHASACVSLRQLASAHVSTRQHTSAHVSIRLRLLSSNSKRLSENGSRLVSFVLLFSPVFFYPENGSRIVFFYFFFSGQVAVTSCAIETHLHVGIVPHQYIRYSFCWHFSHCVQLGGCLCGNS